MREEFMKDWLMFYKEGNIDELMNRISEHKIEETGRRIREIIFREP